jgi:hypothetical protein
MRFSVRVALAMWLSALLSFATMAKEPQLFATTDVETSGGYPDTGLEAGEAYGLGWQESVIHASRWMPWWGTQNPSYDPESGYIIPTAPGDLYWTQIDLPTGAEVSEVCALVRDATPTGQWLLTLYAHESAFPNPTVVSPSVQYVTGVTSTAAATPGYIKLCVATNPVIVHTWADLDGDGEPHFVAYVLHAECYGDVSSLLTFFGATIRWRRTISPAPSTATFIDVPTNHLFFQHIEALAASGITAGCGADLYCPDAPVTRGEVAVFLSKALGLHWAQ